MDKLFEINDYELLSKKVYRILKARIIKGDLKQGSKLSNKGSFKRISC